jgi:hydroxyacylglutathione hydrolase
MNAAIDQPPRHDAEALRIEIAEIDHIDGHAPNVTRRRAAGSAEYCIAVEALTPYFIPIGGRSASPLQPDDGDIMAAEIRLFPCLTDNFGYLIHDPATKATAAIDAPEAAPILKALEREGWTLTDILITHHHGDHVGGVAELKQKYKCRVVAPHDKAARISDVDLRVGQGDVVKVGSLAARVLETPGHTLDHISYVFDGDKALFAADTLFSIGCGRVFEGDYPMMWDSLLKLRALPDDFKLYCGHEYTAANVKFALTVEPDNAALQARAAEVARLRAEGRPTIPTLLADEKKANVFLRADEPSVAAGVRMKGRSGAEVFGELRERKNKS